MMLVAKALAFGMLTGIVSASDPATTILKVPGVGELLSNVLSDGTLESLGIPFAAAPIGQNRFRPPQPARYSGSRLNATAYGAACPQVSITGDVGETSEDCLTLNIWSPASRSHERLPIFFWIHGGGFTEGSGKLYNSSHLANLGVVAVSINYRLGGFAWFTSEEIAKENPDTPGNGGVHGILDQVAALRWVRQHIAAFGGDEKQITIAGESAGSLSTCIHLHLPASKDLFRRAIMESGSCVAGAPWAAWNATQNQHTSKLLAKSVNATDLASLRHVPTATIVKSPFFSQGTPSVDGWYMKRNPAELPVLSKGVDIIVGANTMDSLNAPPFTGLIPGMPDTPNSSSALKSLASDYFGAGIFDVYPVPDSSASQDDVAKEFYRMQGDVCNQCPKHFAAQKFLAADETVFVYEFGFSKAPLKGLACHGCEISDVFNVTGAFGGHGQIDQFMRASYTPQLGDTMSKYWASFIKTGQPRGDTPWPRYTGSVRAAKSLDISTSAAGEPQISAVQGLDSHRCEFFEKFIKESEDHMQKYRNFCNAPVPLSSDPVESTIVI